MDLQALSSIAAHDERGQSHSPARGATIGSVVFAGGGNRCFWQAGFWLEAAPRMNWQPAQVAAVSAGAAIACMAFTGLTLPAIAHFTAAVAANPRNVHFRNLLRAAPVFPHAGMYRSGVLSMVDPAVLARLHAGPDIRVQLTRFPRLLGSLGALLVGGLAYELDSRVRRQLHPRLGRRLGMRPEIVSVRECATPEALADLILASSCTPPFTPALRHGGHAVLDGGIVDNVPMDALANNGVDASAPALILLTRRYPNLPMRADRIYVQPSRAVPVGSWDYTDAAGIQAAFELGRRDGEAFAVAVLKSLHNGCDT